MKTATLKRIWTIEKIMGLQLMFPWMTAEEAGFIVRRQWERKFNAECLSAGGVAAGHQMVCRADGVEVAEV